MATETRNEVLNLINKRDLIEKEIKDMGAILAQNGIGMHDSLIDDQGFPLANIDIYQVRYARNRIICLQNDYKEVMKEIEKGLGQYYSTTNNISTISSGTSARVENFVNLEPFIKVSGLIAGSPADDAGLQDNDLVIEFGSVNASNFKDLSTIADIVRHSENIPLNVRIKRANRLILLQLQPRKWIGKGLLGCVITPIEQLDR